MKAFAVFAGAALFVCLACVGHEARAAEAMDGMSAGAMGIAERSNDCMYKLSRGVANVALGWAELPKMSMRDEGPGEGIQRAMTRTGGGLMDILTFPLASEDEKNYIEPEYFSP